MHENKPRRWERALADCPHCGRTVLFDVAGVCPSCQIRGDAEVTDADRDRIEADRTAQLINRDARPRSGAGDFGTGVLVGLVFGLWGLLGAHGLSRDEELKRGSVYGFAVRFAILAVVMGVVTATRG